MLSLGEIPGKDVASTCIKIEIKVPDTVVSSH